MRIAPLKVNIHAKNVGLAGTRTRAQKYSVPTVSVSTSSPKRSIIDIFPNPRKGDIMDKTYKVGNMRYTETKNLTEEQFRRLTGVKRAVFEKMLSVLNTAHDSKKARGGRPNKLSVEDTLMMALEYLREYRTYFHIGGSYGISESYAYKLVRWVEDTLIKSGEFSLPGKKALLKSDMGYEIVLIDATETPVERPKRGKNSGIPGRKNGIQ